MHGVILVISLAFMWIAFASVWRYHEMRLAAALTAAATNNTTVTTVRQLQSTTKLSKVTACGARLLTSGSCVRGIAIITELKAIIFRCLSYYYYTEKI